MRRPWGIVPLLLVTALLLASTGAGQRVVRAAQPAATCVSSNTAAQWLGAAVYGSQDSSIRLAAVHTDMLAEPLSKNVSTGSVLLPGAGGSLLYLTGQPPEFPGNLADSLVDTFVLTGATGMSAGLFLVKSPMALPGSGRAVPLCGGAVTYDAPPQVGYLQVERLWLRLGDAFLQFPTAAVRDSRLATAGAGLKTDLLLLGAAAGRSWNSGYVPTAYPLMLVSADTGAQAGGTCEQFKALEGFGTFQGCSTGSGLFLAVPPAAGQTQTTWNFGGWAVYLGPVPTDPNMPAPPVYLPLIDTHQG